MSLEFRVFIVEKKITGKKKKKKPKQIIVFQGKEFGLRREYDFIFSIMETRYNWKFGIPFKLRSLKRV